MVESAQAGAQAVGIQSHSVPPTAGDVLAYAGGRLAAPGNLGTRLDHAQEVFEGRVGPTRFVSFDAPEALRSGSAALQAVLGEGPDGPATQLTLASATIAVSRWLAPSDGAKAEVQVVWPMSGSTGAPGPRLPEGATGLVVLDEVAGPLAEAVAELAPGGALWAGPGQPLVDAVGAAEAARWYLAQQKAAAGVDLSDGASALRDGGAIKAALALHRLAAAGAGGVDVLKTALAAGRLTATRALGVRATLWNLGAKDAAAAGFDPLTMDAGTASAFGMAVFIGENGEPTTILAPPPGTPLPDSALGEAP